ncbi:MAG: AI-2E family transporter [Burkholderiales bacterium]|nr:AI-2E family transporter [Burkholderiales bacterium]
MPIRPEQLQAAWWVGLGLAMLWALYVLGPILTPFLAGAVLAYILNPGVDRLARRRVPRTVGALLMLVLLVLALLLVVLIVAPLIRKQITELTLHLPAFLAKLDEVLAPRLKLWFGWDVHFDAASLKALIAEQWQSSDGLTERILASLKLGGLALAGLLGNLLLIPLVLFYLLADWPRLIERIDHAVPRRWHAKVREIAGEIDAVLAEFLRGQLAVMGLLALYYSVALWLGGIDFALPIGIITGGLVFVPYLGFATGLLLALAVAALQLDGLHSLVVVAAVFGFGQVLESFFLTPRIVGDRIGLHPLAVVFALLAFGQVFGFFGVLLALPASAMLLVGMRHLYRAYFASPFYREP